MTPAKKSSNKEENIVQGFIYQYLPYWPLFILLIILGGAGGYAYLKFFAKPVYEVNASILVEDGKKGADESKLMSALNISSNKIVDNEMQIVKSKDLIKAIIDSLDLYASVYEEETFVSRSAYTSSPVTIKLKNPAKIPDDVDKVYFKYDKKNSSVILEGKSYPVGKWVKSEYGVIKFIKNARKKDKVDDPLYFTLTDPKSVLDDVYNSLMVSPASQLSSVIELTYRDESPERGEDILNLLLYNYYRLAIDDKNSLATNTLSFLQNRIDSVSQDLDSIETKLQVFRNQKGVINLSEQGSQYLQNVGSNDNKISDLNMQLAMLNEVEKYVTAKDNSIGIVPSLSGTDQKLLNELLQKLYDSQMSYERLKKTVPEGNPSMYSLKNEINNMRPTILENIQNQRAGLVAAKSSLSSEAGKYRGLLSSIPKNEKELLDINREHDIKSDAYSFLLKKREEAALAYSSLVTNSKTVNTANAGFMPVTPKKGFVFLASIIFALLLGFAFVVFKESMTNKILFRSDIESITDVPVVAEIMNVKKKNGIFGNVKHKELSINEQFHQLRFAIGLNNKLLSHKKILITSGSESEGKSFISNNLALSLASSGKKVVLVDFDLRKPKTTMLYKMNGNIGLAEYFENEEVQISDIIHTSENGDLSVIPAGSAKGNPTELLLNNDLNKLFYYLEEKFDYIIVDSPPVDPIVDAFIVSEYSDAILFVVRHGHSTKVMLESLQKGQKMDALKNNLFIVFNDIKARGFLKKGYGFGYGYGNANMYGNKSYLINRLAKGSN